MDKGQRPLADNTQHSQEKNIHAPRETRARNASKLAVADPRLKTASTPGSAFKQVNHSFIVWKPTSHPALQLSCESLTTRAM
jgi:hypothetical protein